MQSWLCNSYSLSAFIKYDPVSMDAAVRCGSHSVVNDAILEHDMKCISVLVLYLNLIDNTTACDESCIDEHEVGNLDGSVMETVCHSQIKA